MSTNTAPTLNAAEARTQRTFTALLGALSYPGRPHRLPASGQQAFVAIGETLVDLEASYYTPDLQLDRLLARTGAVRQSSAQAQYHFYPTLGITDVPQLRDILVGNHLYPDQSATLIIGCALGIGRLLQLHGPGIADSAKLRVDGILELFWTVREQAISFPLGWDVFLVADDQVVGLPRTTVIEVR